MSNLRFTFAKVIWSKLATQAGKRDNPDLKQMLDEAKKTTTPKGEILIWDPSLPLLQRSHQVLVREESFTRDRMKGGANHVALKDHIRKLHNMITQKGGEPLPPQVINPAPEDLANG